MEEFDSLQQVVSLLLAAGVIDKALLEQAKAQIVDYEQSVPEYLVSSGMISEEVSWAGLESLQAVQTGSLSYEQALMKLSLFNNKLQKVA